MRRIVLSSICIILMLLAGCSKSNIKAILDPTPSIMNAPLTALWYGPLSITRYDPQTGNPSAPSTDAFYLDLKLRSNNTIIGTYTTCPINPTEPTAATQTYDIASGTYDPQRHMVYLSMFANTYSDFNGDSISLNGQRWAVHGDTLLAKYTALLHKIPRANFLSACQVAPATSTTVPTR
jgi:hypothetical protein